MNTSAASLDPRALSVTVNDEELIVALADGRRIGVPILWFPRLASASQAQRERWELLGDGVGLHWPDVDEDISIAALLRGRSSAETRITG
jgi:DNA mismatch repair protein MutH